VNDAEKTRDGFLNNRLSIDQPRSGFRAGHDSVLLAAAVPAREGDAVLELGSGTGVASLCLAVRVKCRVTGIEVQPSLVTLANENAARNGLGERVHFVVGDARDASPGGAPFDHVFFNPPFHPASGQVSPRAARDRATRDSDDAVSGWTARAAALLKPGGAITVIMRPERFEAWRRSVKGEVKLIPLAPRQGEPAKRCIAILRPGARDRLVRHEPIFLHEQDGRPTWAAEGVLRHGAGLV
jgi:tRNA1(Val) A37 N6-methylase TrmN6